MKWPLHPDLALPALASLAAASVAWQAAPLIWAAMGHDPRTLPPEAAPPGAETAAAVDVEPILNGGLFGEPVAARLPETSGTASSIEGLVLQGVLRGVPASYSRAMVIASAGTPRSYAIGDRLPGGGELLRVEIDHIIVRIGDSEQALGFPVKSQPNGVLASGSSGAALLASAAYAPPAAPGSSAATEETINFYRQRVRDNPAALAADMNVTPLGEGYRVGPAVPEQLTRAGLRPGDVVLRVNGRTVGNIDRDRLDFETIAASDTIRVEVRRGERLLTLSFPIR
jgi:general secretion pathway protein C